MVDGPAVGGGLGQYSRCAHLCGEADAQVYISRWFESFCSPPKPDYSTMPGGNSVPSGA